MKKFIVVILSFVALIILSSIIYYNVGLSPVSKKDTPVDFMVDNGSSYYGVIKKLKKEGLIRNEFCFKLYVKFNKVNDLEAGTYKLNKNMSVSDIVNTFSKGNIYNPDAVVITFKEGKNMRYIASTIAENTNNTEEDVYSLLTNQEYLNNLINDYWFIDDSILNNKLYYSLEGYLFPNTYEFLNKDVSVSEIFKKMLDQMDIELTPLKSQIDVLINKRAVSSIHEILTLASIVELEGASSDDRASVAGVFYNRISDGWVLGSDVTTYYYLKIDDFKQTLNGNSNLYTCDNAYNTRCPSYVGLPIGPVSNPGKKSIEATINYKEHDYYYFVADCKGKTYLNYDINSHNSTIQKLKAENNWCA